MLPYLLETGKIPKLGLKLGSLEAQRSTCCSTWLLAPTIKRYLKKFYNYKKEELFYINLFILVVHGIFVK